MRIEVRHTKSLKDLDLDFELRSGAHKMILCMCETGNDPKRGCVRFLTISFSKAAGLGHPVGCTGADDLNGVFLPGNVISLLRYSMHATTD